MNLKKYYTGLFIAFIVIATFGAIYIGFKLGQAPATAPDEAAAFKPNGCTYISGGNCYCWDTRESIGNCCNGSGPLCGSGICSDVQCEFRNVEPDDCNLGQMTVCDFSESPDGVNCGSTEASCNCSCDANVPSPNEGETEVYHGTNQTACANATRIVKYLGSCSGCGNEYFCIACFETPQVSDTPTPTPTGTITITPTSTSTPTVTITVTKTITVTPSVSVTPTLPKTALISDEADKLLFGLLLTTLGITIFFTGMNINLGNGFWALGMRNLFLRFNSRDILKDTIKEERSEFEEKFDSERN
jgi:hypothetical protein